jgi:ABC-type lipoprotein release transport system permease subunit
MIISNSRELCKIAFRNLARHKVKTFLTAGAITISVAAFIFISCFMGGAMIGSRRNIVNFEMGAAKLQTKLYFEKKDDMPNYENFTNWETYRNALSHEGYVSAPRYVFSGTLFSTSGSAPILFHAVEPSAEKEVLRYVPYVDFGRYVENGKFEIALGTVAAEKLKVGIPTRPRHQELEDLITTITSNRSDAEFILSLYDEPTEGNERLILKRDAPKSDLDRYWNLVAATNRNDVRINAVIDIKAVPEIIRSDKWEGELLSTLRSDDKVLVQAAYEYDDFLEVYFLVEENEEQLNQILNAMIRVDFSGAIRHVNQLIDVVVVGVINCPSPLPNGNTAFIPLDVLQGETGMMLGGAVTELIIRDKNVPDSKLPGKSESSATITASLSRGLAAQDLTLPKELEVHTWQEYMKDYLNYEKTENGISQAIVVFLFILSFLGISNTILLAILERTKESAMMRSMGMTDNEMFIVYMLEAGLIGLIGSVLGIILGCVFNYPMAEYGMDFSSMVDAGGVGFRTTGLFRSVWDIPLIIGTGIAATLIASFMAFLPTRRSVKIPITESLRFE